jgi:Protein of unknown function (DUF4246)
MYGLADGDDLNQPLGSAVCEPCRVLCFSNHIQHQVAPFQLDDPSRHGVRKIVAVFLVNPSRRVLSTADVPPQQAAWHDELSRIGSLMPEQVKERLDEMRDFPIDWSTACMLRKELMRERKYMQLDQEDEWFERPFSLCEH